MTQVFIVNVGVNSKHGTLRSPRFPDGTFEFVTIPDKKVQDCSLAIQYNSFPTTTGISPKEFIYPTHLMRRSHYDPEFITPSYGDVPRTNARASNLLNVKKDDILLFYARLVEWSNGRFHRNQSGMYFIGYIEVSEIHGDITERPKRDTFKRISRNAHIIRAECLDDYNGFHVFRGSRKSRRFTYALPFNRSVIRRFRLSDANGEPIKWNRYKSENSAIGAYFRSVRQIDSSRQVSLIREYIDSGE